jgi:hypothetical protein
MALVNKLRKIVDLPVVEWLRYSPFSSAATNTLITPPTADTGSQHYRYFYGTNSTDQWRYDTYSDGWSYFGALLPNSPASTVGGTWKSDDGHHGNMLFATGSVATGSFVNEHAVVGNKIKIIAGTGLGQVKTIVSASAPVDVEYMTLTSYTNSGTGLGAITDSSKKWIINQWRNYQVLVYLGTAQQYVIRKVLYNNNDTLFFANAEWHVIDPHQAYNMVWDGNSITPSTSYGSRAVIQYNTITVDTPWTGSLDKTSKYEIQTGILHSIQIISTNGFFLHYWYDPIYANWFPGHALTTVLPSYTAGTELAIEGIDTKYTPIFVTGSITSATSRSVTDSTLTLVSNQWNNYRLKNLTDGQEKHIISNDTNTFYFKGDWDLPMSASNQFQIVHDDDKMYMNGGSFSTMAQYSLRNNSWYPSQRFDDGVVNIAYVRQSQSFEMQIPITAITRTGQVATVTTITGHPFITGDIVFISGALGVDSQYYNGFFTVTSSYPLSTALTSTTQPTAFTYWMSATPSANATLNAHTTLQVFDTSKNWQRNELSGSIFQVFSSSPTAPTTQYRKIISNTSQSVTFDLALSTGVTSGVWGYNILSSASFGASPGLDTTETSSYFFSGSTVSGTPYVFISSSFSSSITNIPLGAPITGSGIGTNSFFRSWAIEPTAPLFITMSLSVNTTATNNNLVFTGSLALTRGHGIATGGSTTTLIDTTKSWPTNFWAGSRLRMLAGTNAGAEYAITANTTNTLTYATATAPDTSSVYSIIPIQPRAVGSDMKWVYGIGSSGLHNINESGKYLYCFEANSTMRFQKYNIATMRYETLFITPFNHMTGENLTTGTMYAYDGNNRIYIQPNTSARIIYIDTDKDTSESSGQIPAGMSTARQGRKFWVKQTEEGLKYMYIMRHNDTPWWRQLIFW